MFVQHGLLVKELAKALKEKCPHEFKDLRAANITLFGAVERGKYIQSDSFELGLLPVFMEAGGYEMAELILSEWLVLKHGKTWDSQLPSTAGSGTGVHIVAVILARKVVCLAGHSVFSVSLNESSLVEELKEEFSNQVPGVIKLVKATCDNYGLKRKDVTGRRNTQVARLLRTLSGTNEIDLSLSIKAAFGDATSRSDIDVVVFEDCVISHQTS